MPVLACYIDGVACILFLMEPDMVLDWDTVNAPLVLMNTLSRQAFQWDKDSLI